MSELRGTSAFPSHGSMGEVVQEGMTLRDYFAAKAMQIAISEHPYGGETLRSEAARYSYAVADAMIAARSAK